MAKNNVSLNGLRAFEVAARQLSFTSAAKELNITQAAVSQQIRRLEEQIGAELFLRKPRGLSLSPAGHKLAATTRVAIGSIEQTIEQISDRAAKGPLTVSMLASFASRWLIPRLSRFQELHPGIEVHIHTSDLKADFTHSGINAAIRFIDNNKSSLEPIEAAICCEFMMPDALCLVSTPLLARSIDESIDNLYQQKLIIDGSRIDGPEPHDFTALATQDALTTLKIDRSKIDIIKFDQSDSVMIAVLAGQGTAFTRLSLCAGDLEAGRLQILFNYCEPMKYGYSLVYPSHSSDDIKLNTFKRWLHSETVVFRELLSEVNSI
ncbi:MAG: LysR family transcriptional regulator [Oceanospirillaceae bacterium]